MLQCLQSYCFDEPRSQAGDEAAFVAFFTRKSRRGDLGSDRVYIRCLVLDGFSEDHKLVCRLLIAAIFKRFADTGHRLGAVTGVPARCVEDVLNPWATRQSGGTEELALGSRKLRVDCLQLRRRC